VAWKSAACGDEWERAEAEMSGVLPIEPRSQEPGAPEELPGGKTQR